MHNIIIHMDIFLYTITGTGKIEQKSNIYNSSYSAWKLLVKRNWLNPRTVLIKLGIPTDTNLVKIYNQNRGACSVIIHDH